MDHGVYEGTLKDGKPHGQGTLVYFDGALEGGHNYTGRWRSGKKHGYGVMIWKNGDKYVLFQRDHKEAQIYMQISLY